MTNLQFQLSIFLSVKPASLNVNDIRKTFVEDVSGDIHPEVATVVSMENANFKVSHDAWILDDRCLIDRKELGAIFCRLVEPNCETVAMIWRQNTSWDISVSTVISYIDTCTFIEVNSTIGDIDITRTARHMQSSHMIVIANCTFVDVNLRSQIIDGNTSSTIVTDIGASYIQVKCFG